MRMTPSHSQESALTKQLVASLITNRNVNCGLPGWTKTITLAIGLKLEALSAISLPAVCKCQAPADEAGDFPFAEVRQAGVKSAT